MAGTRIQVKSYGANLVARHIDGVARNAEDLRPAKPAVARRVAEGYSRAFGRSGPGWAPLKPSTIRRRVSEGYHGTSPLVKSGGYRKAATNPFALIIDAMRDGFTIRVDYEVAKYHQGGSRHMAARPLRLSFGDRTALVRELGDYIIKGYGRI